MIIILIIISLCCYFAPIYYWTQNPDLSVNDILKDFGVIIMIGVLSSYLVVLEF